MRALGGMQVKLLAAGISEHTRINLRLEQQILRVYVKLREREREDEREKEDTRWTIKRKLKD